MKIIKIWRGLEGQIIIKIIIQVGRVGLVEQIIIMIIRIDLEQQKNNNGNKNWFSGFDRVDNNNNNISRYEEAKNNNDNIGKSSKSNRININNKNTDGPNRADKIYYFFQEK